MRQRINLAKQFADISDLSGNKYAILLLAYCGLCRIYMRHAMISISPL